MFVILKINFAVVGFNRYMVECEFNVNWICKTRCSCFNRYMVECEFHKAYNKASSITVLIDTWWNVNNLTDIGDIIRYPF